MRVLTEWIVGIVIENCAESLRQIDFSRVFLGLVPVQCLLHLQLEVLIELAVRSRVDHVDNLVQHEHSGHSA